MIRYAKLLKTSILKDYADHSFQHIFVNALIVDKKRQNKRFICFPNRIFFCTFVFLFFAVLHMQATRINCCK